MGLDFDKKPTPQEEEPQVTEVEAFDIIKKRESMSTSLVNSKEIDDIVSTISVHDPNSIVTFGAEAATEISKASDLILNSMNMDQINDSGQLLVSLGKIMDKFDIEELKDEKPGFFQKLFNNAKDQIEKILSKYNTMGGEIDKIFIQLKRYEDEINQSNDKLNNMFTSNIEYYELLVKYILAGEQGVLEIDKHLANLNEQYMQTNDNKIQFDIQSLEQARMLLEQRTHDLKIAENVAMQSIPMIKAMQFSNLNLVRKINSAFIITLPVFKQALAQAILLKRQKVQAEAMNALDERTNEMLLKNAQNTVEQTKMTARMASGSSIKIETLEQTWRTIVDGINETKAIQDEARRNRESESIRLQALKDDFIAQAERHAK